MIISMISNRRSSPTPLEDTLGALASEIPSKGELTYEHAYAILKDREELEQPAADDIIEQLNMRATSTRLKESSD
jgi:hypothetical protein